MPNRVCVITGNAAKAAEYRTILGRYAVRPDAVPSRDEAGRDIPADEIARRLLSEGATLVIRESSDLYHPGEATPVATRVHLDRVVNRSVAVAWRLGSDGEPLRRDYSEKVEGFVDLTAPDAVRGFGWDGAFRNAATGRTYEEDARAGLKSSARDMVFACIARDHLHFERPVDLAFRPLGAGRLVDFDLSPRDHLLGIPWMRTPAFAASPVSRLLAAALRDGVFFRSSHSRRERNYWLPGLNGGIPLVPKKDDIHEITFQFHDLMHAVMPDLIFDGNVSKSARRVYMLHRMTGEAISLVCADHAFADTLALSGCDYDLAKRRIHPLFSSLEADVHTPEGLYHLAYANMRYAVLGDAYEFSDLGADVPALTTYREKYERFFVEDYTWTDRNFARMSEEAPLFAGWAARYSTALGRAGVETVSAFSERVRDVAGGRDLDALSLEDLAVAVFIACWDRFFAPALAEGSAVELASPGFDVDLARSNAFRRWLLGQAVMYERYAHVPGIARMGELLASVLNEAPRGTAFRHPDILRLRGFHELAVDRLGETRAVSAEEVRLFKEVVPVFDPLFAFYDAKPATESGLSATVERLFGEPPIPPRARAA